MKKIMAMLLSGFMLSSFTNSYEHSLIDDSAKLLSGYKVRDEKLISFHDYNLWAITNEEAFDKTFIADSEAVTRPRFDTEMVLAAKVESLANSYKVTFKKVVLVNDHLDVYFSIDREGPSLQGAGPLTLVTWPKNQHVKKVNFYHGSMVVKTVHIVNVY